MTKETKKEMSDIIEDISIMEKTISALYKTVEDNLPIDEVSRANKESLYFVRRELIQAIFEASIDINNTYKTHFVRTNLKIKGAENKVRMSVLEDEEDAEAMDTLFGNDEEEK